MKFAKHTLGNKQYELTNHLGNVLVTVSDNRRAIANLTNPTQISHYEPYISTINDYYPFGMSMAERSYQSEMYRFGFNGQEKVDEITGQFGSHNTALFWEYDTRLGRRWNLDPVIKEWQSPYNAFSNRPIANIDPNGSDDTDYGVKPDGTVALIGHINNEPDRLFALNNDGTVNNDIAPITVNDKTVLPNLCFNLGYSTAYKFPNKEYQMKYETYKTYHYADLRLSESGNKNDMYNIFHFASNNTSVEWALGTFNINGKSSYVIGTRRSTSMAPRFDLLHTDWSFDNQLVALHDHALGALLGASGYTPLQDGDLQVLILGNPNTPHFVYDVTTKSVFQYTKNTEYINRGSINSYQDFYNVKGLKK